jgi:Flp pilus assembly protein TadB
MQLWMPILLAAVLVFAASALIHMVFKWHNAEYRRINDEDAVRAVLRAAGATPGQYMFPHCDPKEMGSPEVLQKFKEGPVGFVTLGAPGAPSMGKPLGQWFVLTLLVALAAGYLASRTVPVGASFLAVARVVGLVSFLAYATGSVINAIWFVRPWGSVAKDVLDSLIYGLVSAAAFGWLWPR